MGSASSSLVTPPSGFLYDVFICFRGEDTRDGFTDHLYTALKLAGFRAFRDDVMERGKQLSPGLDKAIRESAILLIVFSEGFASSDWCLDEVLMIMNFKETSSSKHEVIPFFYKLDPSDVKNQKGSFKAVFDAYEEKIKSETNPKEQKKLSEKVKAWRESLTKVANLTGIVYREGYESKYINDVVNCVIKKVDNKGIYIGDRIVGIDDNVNRIESWLNNSSPEEVVLLIDGMGGIGKSTIAKCIYNLIFRNYDASCFLEDISKRASNQDSALCSFQSQLLSKVLKREKEQTIWGVDEGTKKVTDAISNKKVLLILDDVATPRQLEALLGTQSFYPGSKVIITTRNTLLLTAFRVRPKVYTVRELLAHHDIELFSLYAFDQHQPPEPYITLSHLFVNRCMGHPSSLKEWGIFLSTQPTIDAWNDTWRCIETAPNSMVQKVLQSSYETLEYDIDKDLFLHIACFFEGDKKNYIVTLLTECDLRPEAGINILIGSNLVFVEDGRVKMHQSIKDMGREVVRKESDEQGERSRLWRHQDCYDVLKYQSGTRKVKGLMFDTQKTNEAFLIDDATAHGEDENFEIGALENMNNLMLLQVKSVTFSGECNKFPQKLRLLSWHGFSPSSISIQGRICLQKLVVLDMSCSKLKRLQNDFLVIKSLKILNLGHSVELTETPDFGGLPALESLILKGCSSLTKVHESIAYLQGLFMLDLTDCRSLVDLPVLPESLKEVIKIGCPHLED